MATNYYVTLGVTEAKTGYSRKRWRVLTSNTTLRAGEREIKLKLNMPDNFFTGPTVTVNIDLPEDHGIRAEQEK